ncbi:hypothetical protein BD311DRAFT_676498 [Dichomitus squalens]|uniref:ARID domain-containing protein n=1 Tax=Dichomitus squalens TaxID=114155 RepID=A0A4Q9M5J8_9APHY|nr:hypothetical protein BD311DRAFT_676498 [Dichomitus squalens]
MPMQLGQLEQAMNMLSISMMRPDPLPNGVGPPFSLWYAPLTRESFTKAYFQQWILKHLVDQTMLKVEGREIDLYQLHYEVMSQNGYLIGFQHTAPNRPFQFVPTLVISQEQWPVIAGRLGFVNFPGNGHEPARSGPAIAVHIEQVYKRCLQYFDSQYLCHLFHNRRLSTLEQKVNGGDMSAGPSGPADPQGLSNMKDPKALGETISYAELSAPELQARGVPDHIIALVEKHRDQLKATLQQQRNCAKIIQIAAQGQPRDVSNPEMAIANAMLHHQANGMNRSSTPPNGQQQQQVQQRPGSAPGMLPISTGRPTLAQMVAAVAMVRRLKEENKHVQFPTTRPVHIDDAQRLEYNAQFKHLHRLVTTLDQKLPHLAVCMREDVIKKLVMMISVVQQQREMLSSNPTQYFMPLQWVQQMIMQVNQANHAFTTWVNNAMRSGPPADGN